MAGVREQVVEMSKGGKCISPAITGRKLGVSRQRIYQICQSEGLKVAPKQKNFMTCNECGKTFLAHYKKKLFCSKACLWKYTHIEVECEICGRHFNRPKSELIRKKSSRHIFCSKRCQGIWFAKNFVPAAINLEIKECPGCGGPVSMNFRRRRHLGKTGLHFCSSECALRYFRIKRKELNNDTQSI